MKFIKLLLIIVTIHAILSVVEMSSKSSSSFNSKHKSRLRKSKKCPGGGAAPKAAWNNVPFPDTNTYAYVNSDPYILQHQAGFKNAKIWPGRLPEHLNYFPYTGEFGAAHTGIHNKNYYDGSIHLNKLATVNCGFYSTQPRDCVNKPGCGWCGQSNQCIGASPLGPIAPCIRSSFIYNLPTPDWNPLKAPAINIHAQDKNGNSMLKVTWEPELQFAKDQAYTLEK